MSTLALCAHVIFPATTGRGRLELRKVHAVEVATSVHDVCQRATITLPRNVSQLDQAALRTYIRRADPVEVWLGYNGDLQLEFDGYVERVGGDVPMVIELRDGLWKWLQEPFTRSYKSCHVPTLIQDMNVGTWRTQVIDANVGPVRFERTTKSGVLKALKDEFGLITYFKGGTLFVGELFDAKADTATYDVERNVRSSNLVFKVAADTRIQLKARSIKPNGDDIEVTVGDPDGEHRTLTYYGIESETELQRIAEADLKRFRYDGWEGSFTGFGVPMCRFGDKVRIRSSQYPERDSDTVAEAVTVRFGPTGFEREVKPAQEWM